MPVDPRLSDPEDPTTANPNDCPHGCHWAEDGVSFVLDNDCPMHG